MDDATLEEFKKRWLGSEASERSNSQMFLTEFTDLLGVPHPRAAVNDPARDQYVFERRVQIAQPGGERVGWIDLYKEGCFVLESKQGANEGRRGFAKRDTPMWENEMERARGQAKGYAQTLAVPPPFVIVCDVGHVFEIHACFDRSGHWTAFPDPPKNRLYLADFGEKELAFFRKIWTDPYALDPSLHQAQVSRDVAEPLALIARSLEERGHAPEVVAEFLMRCIFTMFAEDVGLFPGRKKLFEDHLRQFWVPNPKGFPAGVEVFWSTMNTGGMLMTGERIREFNGGLFANPVGLPLTAEDLGRLHHAATLDWSQVEPAVFGTLLERALDPKERHRLGAHFTPRAYVERLVRPTIIDPLRSDWLVVQAESRRLRDEGKVKRAAKVLQEFHRRLCDIRVLDPACGSGNFLYVALDLMKHLEAEVREELRRLGDEYKTELMEFDTLTIQPNQFLGLEKKRWAKEIAELVLWIGYLRWHFRSKGDRGEIQVPEPVLEDYSMIECRDAILDWDGAPEPELVLDEDGEPVTRWSGTAGFASDENDGMARVSQYAYPNPRVASWPPTDFIVGNPPFVGTRRMRVVLGDGYVDALAQTFPDVPDNADYVMFWWHLAAEHVRTGRARAFGLITTNSITQTFNRALVQHHLRADPPLSLAFAIPDHPWVDSEEGAAVRVAMTVGVAGPTGGQLLRVLRETALGEGAIDMEFSEAQFGVITQDLRVGASPAEALPLQANAGIAYWGVKFYGKGFIVTPERAEELAKESGGAQLGRPFVSGKDLTKRPRGQWVIDCDGIKSEDDLRQRFPAFYQHLLLHVKPVRIKNPRAFKRKWWWIHGENQPGMRRAVKALERYIVTVETATHRVFTFIDKPMLAEGTVCVIALSDPLFLGVLSSRVHVTWALAAGGRLGVGNDPRYNKTRCFDPFPFPTPTEATAHRIRALALQIDEHRKRQVAAHPRLTITGLYNVLSKLRDGEPLSENETRIHEDGLVSLLQSLHDELDAAVLEAYGWPSDLNEEGILIGLVELNHARAQEEARGVVHWLRPEIQRTTSGAAQPQLPGTTPSSPPPAIAAGKPTQWPRKFPERAAAVRDVVLGEAALGAFTAQVIATRFRRAKPEHVTEILDAFVALGLLVAFEIDGARHWARPAPAAVS